MRHNVLTLDTDEIFLSRDWFASWLSSKHTVGELRYTIGRTDSLVSKFRSGAALPGAAHLAAFARVFDEYEFVLAAVALLDEFEPLRAALSAFVADPGDDETPHRALSVDAVIRDGQLDARLSPEFLKVSRETSPRTSILIVPDGHGCTALQHRLRRRTTFADVLDLSDDSLHDDVAASERIRHHSQRGAVAVVVPRSRADLLDDIRIQPAVIDDVTPVTWSQLLTSMTATAIHAAPLRAIDSTVIRDVPLDLCVRAVQALHAHLTRPVVMPIRPRRELVVAASPPKRTAPLSATQCALVGPALGPRQRPVGLVVPDIPGLATAVADHLASSGGGARLIENPTLQALVAQWDNLVAKPAWVPKSVELDSNPTQSLVVDLSLGSIGLADAADAILLEILRRLADRRPELTWRLCGTIEQVVAAGSVITDAIDIISVPRWPTKTTTRTATRTVDFLPDVSNWTSADAAKVWEDGAVGLNTIKVLGINGVVQLPPGQGGSTAVRALMAMRAEAGTDDLHPEILSLDAYVQHDRAMKPFDDSGFPRPFQAAVPKTVSSPYLRLGEQLSDREVLDFAEEVSRRAFDLPRRLPKSKAPGRVFVDLSATRYGRVPTTAENWNQPERLTNAYTAAALDFLALVQAAFPISKLMVFLPTGLETPDSLFPASDWQRLVVEPLPSEAVRRIFSIHGVAGCPDVTQLQASLATANVVGATDSSHDAPKRR